MKIKWLVEKYMFPEYEDELVNAIKSSGAECYLFDDTKDKWFDIKKHVLNNMERGVTILEGKGGYTNESKPVLMIVIPQKMYSNLEHEIMQLENNLGFFSNAKTDNPLLRNAQERIKKLKEQYLHWNKRYHKLIKIEF